MKLTSNISLLGPALSSLGVERTIKNGKRETAAVSAPAFDAAVAIVVAYLKNATCSFEQVRLLLDDVHHASLEAMRREKGSGRDVSYDRQAAVSDARIQNRALTPAVAIEESVFDEYLICLEDGKKLKSLKRYLRTWYGMTTDQYKLKWKLPDDYPLVAPALSRKRSIIAKQVRPHEVRGTK